MQYIISNKLLNNRSVAFYTHFTRLSNNVNRLVPIERHQDIPSKTRAISCKHLMIEHKSISLYFNNLKSGCAKYGDTDKMWMDQDTHVQLCRVLNFPTSDFFSPGTDRAKVTRGIYNEMGSGELG